MVKMHQVEIDELLSKLDWRIEAADFKLNVEKLISDSKKKIEEILALSDEDITFNNVVLEFEHLFSDIRDQSASLYFPAYVSPNQDVRNASSQASEILSKFYIDVGMDPRIYSILKKVKEKEKDLEPVDQLLLDRTLRDYVRNGLELSEEKRAELMEINKELSKIAIDFNQELNEVDDKVVFTPEELAGVPDSTLNSFQKDEDGNFVVGVTYPEYFPVMTYCKVPETRRKLSTIFGNRAREKNTPRLKRALELRDKAAKLLGYSTHAEFALEVKMAEKPENVLEFLNQLKERLIPLGKEEIQELLKLKDEELGEKSSGRIEFEDYRYYTTMYKEKKYKVDGEEVKQYFPTEHVVQEMLKFYQEIFDLTFVLLDDPPRWHEDVLGYAIYDSSTEEFIGIFFLDLHPRKGKFSHAAAFTLIKGHIKRDGSYQHTVSAMVCNFPKSTPDNPSLLTHSEVETLFHEFGHIIHQTTTKAKYGRFSGSSVSGDFVEAPSQMLENWVWEEEILNRISKHYKTGSPLPSELLKNMLAAKNANIALHYLRQLHFGLYDMKVHHEWTEDLNIEQLWHDLYEEVALVASNRDTFPGASFGHIIGGYDAGYYGYLWSEVYAQDLYTRFEKEGPLSKAVGKDYRRYILEPGNEIPEIELVKQFLGREPTQDAFMKSIGIKK